MLEQLFDSSHGINYSHNLGHGRHNLKKPKGTTTRRAVLVGLAAAAVAGAILAEQGASTPTPPTSSETPPEPENPTPTPSTDSSKPKELLAYVRGTEVGDFVDLDVMTQEELSSLTHLAYFGAKLGEDGTILRGDPTYQSLSNPSVKELLSRARKAHNRLLLTVTMFDEKQVANLFAYGEDAARAKAVDQIATEVIKNNFDGVAIDIETWQTYNALGRKRFTTFIEQLQTRLQKDNPQSDEVVVNVAAGAAENNMLWDLEKISKICHHIMIMAYEYYSPNSPQLGPTAPLNGSPDIYQFGDVSNSVDQFLELMDPSDLILGHPFYGLAAEVSDQNPTLPTTPNGPITYWTYANALKYLLEHQNDTSLQWADLAQMDWYRTDLHNGNYMQVVVGSTKMLQARCKYVKDTRLKGLGIWTMDQESYNHPDPTTFQMIRAALS